MSTSSSSSSAPLWRHFSFTLMWSSVAASGFGDRMIQLAAWELLGISKPGAQASSIQAAVYCLFFIPYLIFSPLGGYLADTLPRKWVMFACDELRGLLLLATLAFLPMASHLLPDHDVWKLYAMILGVGTLAAIFSPTRNATIPQIVPTRQLQAANAMVLGIAIIASMIGLGLGSRLIERSSLRTGLWLGAGLYLVSGTFFAFMKVRQHQPTSTPHLKQGHRLLQAGSYLYKHRAIRQLIILNALFWAGANVLLGALAALCKTRYNVPADLLKSHIADLGMFMGIGMLTGSLLVAWLRTRRESQWITMFSLLVTALCMLGIALSRSYQLGLVLAIGAGFFGNTAMICLATLTQSLTPDYIRGRVFGLRDLITTLSIVITNALIWRVPHADAWLLRGLIVTSVILAGVVAYYLPGMLTRGPMPSRTANILWRFGRLYCLVWHRLEVTGHHHLPPKGPVLIASNHTTALDPLLLQTRSNRLIHWLMLAEYQFRWAKFAWRALQPIALQLDKPNMMPLRQIINTLKKQEVVGLFPEGGLQRDHRQLQPLQPGLAMVARRSGATIIPTWIQGTPLRKHMFWHFATPSHSRVRFGAPMTISPDADNDAIMEELQQRLLALQKELSARTSETHRPNKPHAGAF